jgi:16S rRNA (guanine966-N2)-methyltransferase
MTGPRILAGTWRGRKLAAPPGLDTRPTSARARQAMFDILLHAPWAGHGFMQTARALDVFAGTGAFGLEALSRGAAAATFIENSAEALAALRANVAACNAKDRARVVATDALHPPAGTPHDLVFLDPPYGQGLVGRAVAALTAAGWVAPAALMVAEFGPEDEVAAGETVLAARRHGKAQLVFWRA